MKFFWAAVIFILLFPVYAGASVNATTVEIQPMHIRVSSFFTDTNQLMFNGKALYDGDYNTAWEENSDGNGKGQWIEIFFPDEVVVDSIYVRNGKGTGKAFKNLNRVKSATFIYSDRRQVDTTLADSEAVQTLKPLHTLTTSLSLVVNSVYQGTSNQTAAVSEFYATYHHPDEKERNSILAAEEAARKKLEEQAEKKAEKLKKQKSSSGRSKSSASALKRGKKRDPADKLLTKEEARKVFAEFFDKLYSSFVTMSDDYPRMYAEKEYMRESIVFDSFKYQLKNRGVLKYYQDALVDTRDLKIEIESLRKREADLRVTGFYDVVLDLKLTTIPEDSKYYLVKEYGKWKVAEKVENPF
jgi:hypothetical protein